MPYSQQRRQKDQFFKTSPHSPLNEDQREKFTGLNYYPADLSLVFELEPEVFLVKRDVQMLTSTGDLRTYRRWGRAALNIGGQEVTLTLFFAPGQPDFFVPFYDATNGTETYKGGRYMEVHRLSDGQVRLDLNEAYNPFCAYTPMYSCPIPPDENRLTIPIRAGEKLPDPAWIITAK
jgi:uncharacterized protein